MIKFFRKIRQKLLSENKFSKYLIYAIGEIVLVVIGILIALQINSLQQKKINRKVEQALLKSIILDLKGDIYDFENVRLFKESQNESCLRLINYYIKNSNQAKDTSQFVNDLQLIQYFMIPNTHRTSYETSVNTGTINNVTNKDLLTDIANYYSNIGVEQHVTETKRFTNAFSENHLAKKYFLHSKYVRVYDGNKDYILERYKDDTRPVVGVQDIKDDIRLENYLNIFSIRLTIGINGIKYQKEWALRLIRDIESEIGIKN